MYYEKYEQKTKMTFDISNYKNLEEENTRYSRRLQNVLSLSMEAQHIERTVSDSLANLYIGNKSFVIYGEPQSGKTAMMIALTAKLLDDSHKIIIILLNDNIQLLSQNLDRFRRYDIDPTPADMTCPQ